MYNIIATRYVFMSISHKCYGERRNGMRMLDFGSNFTVVSYLVFFSPDKFGNNSETKDTMFLYPLRPSVPLHSRACTAGHICID